MDCHLFSTGTRVHRIPSTHIFDLGDKMFLTIYITNCILYLISVVLGLHEWKHWKAGFCENGKFISKYYAISFTIFRLCFVAMLGGLGYIIYAMHTHL